MSFTRLAFQLHAAAFFILLSLHANAQSTDSFGPAAGFNAFVEANFESQYTDVEGRLAAGGNIALESYGVASKISVSPETQVLIAGQNITYNNGMIFSGSVLAGGSAALIANNVRNGMAVGSSITDNAQLPFDFASEFSRLRDISATLAQADVTGSVVYQWGGVKLTGDCSADPQVFLIDGSQLKTASSLSLECVPADATLIFNVSGANPGMQNIGLAHLQPRANKILWNFYEAQTVSFSSIGVEGSILAPHASLDTPWGYVNGTVMVKSWTGHMELHHVPFVGDISSFLSSEAPIIVTEPNVLGYENTPYEYDVDATDEDVGDVLTHSIDLAPPGFSINPNSGLISWAPANGYVGSVEEFNSQCYVVPTGGVSIVEEGEQLPDGRLAIISPLFKRVKEALEISAEYTARESVAWDQRNGCLGCHIQTQSLLGLETSIEKVEVDELAVDYLINRLFDNQQANGTIVSASHTTTHLNNQTSLALWSLSSYPDRALTFNARSKALGFFMTRPQTSGSQTYWGHDHDTGWMNNAYAVTALVTQAGARILDDVLDPNITFTETDYATAQSFRALVPNLVEFFLAAHEAPVVDVTQSAFRLIGLSELRPFVSDGTTLIRMDRAIEFLDQYLRSTELEEGGWAFRTGQTIGSPVASAWVGIALNYLNPDLSDPVIIRNIEFLLSVQDLASGANYGTWRDASFFPGPNLAATSLVMSYLPVALDFLGNPDLHMVQLSLVEQGDLLQIQATVTNRGIKDVTGESRVRFYAGGDADAPYLGEATVPPIASGASANVSFSVDDPALIGTDIFAEVIVAEDVLECEIRNNKLRSAVVRHRVADRRGLFDIQLYALSIKDQNSVPVITSPAEFTHQQAQLKSLKVTIADADIGDAAFFKLEGAPIGVYINDRTGEILVDGEVIEPGDYSFVVKVKDLRGGTAEQQITFTINQNLPPQIVSMPVAQKQQGDVYSYDVEAVDPNGDVLRYGMDSANGFSIRNNTGELLSDADLPLETLRTENEFCEALPQEIDLSAPVVKWHWTSAGKTAPTYSEVMQTPIAVPLFDTNANGIIDGADDIALVFSSYPGRNYDSQGVLRAVSASTGEALWTNVTHEVRGAGSLAGADIDGDGYIEILAPAPGGGINAYEHDGTFKWRSTSTVNIGWGSVAIADIDSDGSPDIVAGNVVINSDGTTKWVGAGPSGQNGPGALSIVADINLDGAQEVIAGAAAYSNDGTLLFNFGDGFSSVGNFDADDFPEIVRVFNSTVYLHDHDGSLIWSAALSGGGRGGAPTIADINGDGKPDIGVAGAAAYNVFDSTGARLWSAPTQDISSNVTGSSVFDFDGDGAAEVVYADEKYLRIYRGATGDVLYEVPNPSGTTFEYPLIVDVDKDDHAEIVIGANQLVAPGAYPGFSGLRVIESSNDSWVATRSIWNQHSYHITNINDDGTVPQNEQPSWLSHNTYRLNTFADKPALSAPDLAAFELKYDESTQTLSTLVVNRGLAQSNASATITFYSGNPDDGGVALGSRQVAPLSASGEQRISIPGISAELLAADVFVEVEYEGSAEECITANNRTSAKQITVMATDEGGLTDSQTYLFSVINRNDLPRIVNPAASTINAGADFELAVQVEDRDVGDAHRFALADSPSAFSINGKTGVVSANAGNLPVGLHSFRVIATDLSGASAEQTHVVTVAEPDNLPPVFVSVPPAQANVSTSLFYTAIANDPDGDEVVFVLKVFPAGAVLDGVTGELSWTPRREQAGLQIFDITALDTSGATSSQRFAVDVVDPQANNQPPQITSRPSGLVVAGKVFDYQVVAVDPDGDELNYSLRSPTGNMVITSAGHFSWLPDINSVGRIFTVEIVVKDSLGAETIQTLSLPVNEPSNTPPQITSTPGTSVLVAQQYRYQLAATDSDGDPIRFELGVQKPNGMTIDSAGLVQWTPANQQANQIFEVEVRAVDSRGAISTQSFSIAVNIAAEPNELPFFVSVPTSPALVGEAYVYQARAEDLDRDSLTYELASSALAGLQLSSAGLLTWTPTIEQVGEYNIAIKVSDGKGAVTQSYMLEVREPGDLSNEYPVISSTPETEAIVNELYSYQLIASDPDGDTLSFEMLSELGEGVSFSAGGLLQWTPAVGDLGIRNFLVKVSDGQLARTQSWSVKVWDGVPPLRVFLNVDPTVANEGDMISLSVAKTGGASDTSLSVFVDGDEIALDSMGNTSVIATGFGLHQVRAVATSGSESAEETMQYLVRNTADVVPPVAVITTPEHDDIVTESVAIIGTASDTNIVAYELYLAPVGSDDWTLINSGNTSVTDGELGTLDPTLMVNGQYTLQLQVTDINGQIASDTKIVALDGDLKVGNFSFTVKDLSVPMVGIPIEVSRTYDSRRRAEKLDFGYGWSVDYQNVKVEESRIPGRFWDDVQVRRGPFGLIADFCVEPLGAPVVTVTLPTGKVERFEASASPRCTTYNLIRDVELVFNPVGDTLSKLVPLDDRYGYYMNGQIVENGFYSAPLNPNRYKLTTQAGYEYILNQAFGIEKVIDPNGHTLTYTNDGIFHSSGKAVTFGRDSQGRITDVIAPNGSRLTYHYDGRDDLEMVVDRDESQTRYTYNNSHGLLDILDPLNRPVLKNLYDEQGRLYAQEDGNGVVKTFDHDLDAKTSLVTDRDGRSTLFEYDEEGLIASETVLIADGSYEQDIVTSYGYDANGNQETRTIGDSVWEADFDARNNQLFAKDPEGHTVFYRDHNDRGQEGEVEDEMGRISKMTYDSAGNLYLVEMPEVVDPETGETEIPTAGNTINARGLVSKTVDLSGLETTYTYYPKGHQWEDQKKTEANSVIGTITYTYDGNNNVKTETRDRTVDGVVAQEAVTYDYDARDRLTKTTYPDGTYSETVYDLAGNTDKERDRLGVWTDYEYDAYGRLIQTDYADGTSEIRTYTAEGLLETITDRSGYVTRNEYDGAGRLWKVHNEQDGSFTETRYTLQGWVQYEWDEKRNRTEHRYDKAGRRTHTIRVDDAGNELVWSFEYYPNGELHNETDPLNHTTEYVINELDQRTATLYHNGTSLEERYDLMGRRTATIDQNLRRTAFGYDDLGRLTGVTPEVSINGEPVPETAYTYDQVGNKLSQTDANGHITRWTYDFHGRVLSRTLPEGMSESFEYVDAERKTIHTDFNGDTITTFQDEMGRVERVEYSKDGAVDSFTYWPNDQIKTATTAEGTTEYFYDQRHRLDYELRPDGTRMDYDYDLVGNRTLVKVTRAGAVTSQMSYTYDDLNRLETAINDLVPGETTDYAYDAAGNLDTVTYPNGLVTDYDYNSINQLTDVYTRDDSGTLISHYAYRLDNTGRRTVVTEHSGRTTAYCHDELYRLKAETVFDTATALTEGCLTPAQRTGASYTADYQYDWTGNRTYETVDGVQTAYTYDDNDRLLQTGGTVYGYDDNGNTVSETLDGDVTTYQYNGKNQLISTDKAGTTTTYTYNPNGIRNGKTEGGTTTRFIVDENRDYAQVLEEITNGTIATTYSYGHDLISQDKNGATSFYHYDGLGSTRALSDVTGTLTDTYDYEAFGELLSQTGSTDNSYLFTGEQFDAGLNQYYLRARYYNQQIGRFTQMDTWMGNNHDPITLHKYAYGNADPVTYADPSGNFGLGSFGASFSIQGALTAVSIGSSAYDLFMVATGQQELTASDVGMHLLLGGAGKLVGKLGQRYADSLRKFVKGLGCNSFAADTFVTTKDGLVEIQHINIGDMVLTLNEETGLHEYRKVIHVINSTELKQIIRIELSNGAVIEPTPGHLIYVDGKWLAAEEIQVGQNLYSLGIDVSVAKIVALERSAKVYNLTVDGNHNYFVGEDGILAHNISPCEKAAKELSKLVPKKCLGNGQCKQFAKEFEALLSENKVNGKRLCLRTKVGIFSDTFGLIGDTGLHAAVQVGELVFDNNNPKGIPYKDWLNDLGGEGFIQPPGKGAQIDLHLEDFGTKSNCLD